MGDRPKRKKLGDRCDDLDVLRKLLHTGGVSMVGLRKLLSKMNTTGFTTETLQGRRILSEANSERFPNDVWSHHWSTCWQIIIAQQGNTCGPHITLGRFKHLRCVVKMPLKSGGSFDWEFVDPNKLLTSIVGHSPGLTKLYTEAWGVHLT